MPTKTMLVADVLVSDIVVENTYRYKITEKDDTGRSAGAEILDLKGSGEPRTVRLSYETEVEVQMDVVDPRLGTLELATESVDFHLRSDSRVTVSLLTDGSVNKMATHLGASIGEACTRDLKEFHDRMVQACEKEGYNQAVIEVFIKMVKEH